MLGPEEQIGPMLLSCSLSVYQRERERGGSVFILFLSVHFVNVDVESILRSTYDLIIAN